MEITTRNSIEQRLVMQYNIARVLAESNSVNKAAGQVLQMICETAEWEYGALWRVDPESHMLINEGVWYAGEVDLSAYADAVHYSALKGDQRSLPGEVLITGEPLWLTMLADFHSPDADAAVSAGLQSAFVLPVHSDEKVIAILECLSTRPQRQDQVLLEMLTAVGNQVGIFLERKQLEEALANYAAQQQLLAQAGIALTTTLDYEQRLHTITHLIVPDLADWCAIDIIDKKDMMRRMAAAHVDPAKEPLVYALQPARQVDFEAIKTPAVETLLTGKSLLYTDIPASMIDQGSTDPENLEILRKLDPRSAMLVPLTAHGRILGICTFVQSDSGRRYLANDLALAEDIVRRVGLSLDNALLYAESQELNAGLERLVEERTAQLKRAIDQLTRQIDERQRAEGQVRVLNTELEQRIAERTSQLEAANADLQKEVAGHQQASRTLRTLLRRTRELYRISQAIGSVRSPDEVLSVLLSSTYLKNASRASIAILDQPWLENGTPPEGCSILAEWNRGARQPKFLNKHFTLEEYGIVLPVAYGQQVIVQDIQSLEALAPRMRKRFADLGTHSLITLPLIATGEWYGLLSLHFKKHSMDDLDDLRHVRGLVDQAAIAIQNMLSLEAESKARHEAEVANDLKLKFLAMISHELRTPLTSIKGFATTLLAEDVVWDADTQLDFLQTINSESDKLSDLIEQLLDLSRIEAGILRITQRKLNLGEIAGSALTQLHVVSAGHPLEMDLSSDLPPVFGDPLRIPQVLTNLVGNAARYSPAGSPITVSARRSGDYVQVDVADRGSGIPPHERDRVFEAFRQLQDKGGNRTRGAGLGLAICKGLVEAQGGAIWIQDRPAPGTVVSFTVPIFTGAPGHSKNITI